MGPGAWDCSRTPPWGAPRLAGGGVTSHPGRRGHGRCGNLSVAGAQGLPGPSPRAPLARGGRASCHRPRAVAETTPAPGTRGRPCQAPGAPPGGAEPRTDMLLPFPAPSERRGVGEAGPGCCTEEPPVPRADRPRGGGARACPGMAGRPASAHRPAREGRAAGGKASLPCAPSPWAVWPAGPRGLTPGDPALRPATAALAQAVRPPGCVTVTGLTRAEGG